jgi:hypothetical protein
LGFLLGVNLASVVERDREGEAGGRELLAEPLGKRGGECVDLADGRLAAS